MISKQLLYGLLLVLVYACDSGKVQSTLLDEELSAFTQLNGEADYTYEEGVLTGTSRMGIPTSFLATKESFRDFILEFEVWVDHGLNSGVQIRSQSIADYHDGRVHGYQVEIDTSPRAWSGGIYDEFRRGWLYPLSMNESARSAFHNDQWNLYRIEAIGDTIKTWVNGIPVAHMVDDKTEEGFIAFQVHSIYDKKDAGKQVKWRKITLQTDNLGASSIVSTAPQESYLNNTITQDEALLGWQLLDADMRQIESREPFEIKFDFKIIDSIGVHQQYADKYYYSLKPHDSNDPIGSLMNIQKSENHSEEHNSNVRYKGDNKWNRAQIKVDAGQIQHWLNGIKVIEYPIESLPMLSLSVPRDSDIINYKDWKVRL